MAVCRVSINKSDVFETRIPGKTRSGLPFHCLGLSVELCLLRFQSVCMRVEHGFCKCLRMLLGLRVPGASFILKGLTDSMHGGGSGLRVSGLKF